MAGVGRYEGRLISDSKGSFMHIRVFFSPASSAVPLKDFKRGSNKIGFIVEQIK